jgi:hypothetical protein
VKVEVEDGLEPCGLVGLEEADAGAPESLALP